MTLRPLAERTVVPGQMATADYNSDYPLIYASSSDEMLFYIKQLGKLGFAEVSGQFATITATGYQRLLELQTASIFSNTVFVAMSFASEVKPVYEKPSNLRLRKLVISRSLCGDMNT